MLTNILAVVMSGLGSAMKSIYFWIVLIILAGALFGWYEHHQLLEERAKLVVITNAYNAEVKSNKTLYDSLMTQNKAIEKLHEDQKTLEKQYVVVTKENSDLDTQLKLELEKIKNSKIVETCTGAIDYLKAQAKILVNDHA